MDLVTFTGEILNGKLHFLFSELTQEGRWNSINLKKNIKWKSKDENLIHKNKQKWN